MTRLALALLVTLSGTFPTTNALHDSLGNCWESQAPLDDLNHVLIMQQVQGSQPHAFSTLDARGREGATFSLVVPSNVIALYWAEAYDDSGNALHLGARCGPNVVQVSSNVSVEPQPVAHVQREEWYDILGRRLSERPKRSGIYWVARETGSRKRLVWVR